MPCVVARHRSSLWAVLHRGQVVPCVFGCVGVVCVCVLKLAGGTDTQPLRQLSWGCQAGVRDQFLPETGATGRSSLQSPTQDLGTH